MTHGHIAEQMEAQKYLSLGLAGLHVCLCHVSHRGRLHTDRKRGGQPTGEPSIYFNLITFIQFAHCKRSFQIPTEISRDAAFQANIMFLNVASCTDGTCRLFHFVLTR